MSRTITITKEVFKYQELPNTSKQKVKEWYLEGQDGQLFLDMVKQGLMIDYGLELDVGFSLGYCQGDGLCLYGEISFDQIRNNETMKKIVFKGFNVSDYRALHELECYVSHITLTHRGRYFHSNSVDIDIDYYAGGISDKMDNLIDKVVKKILTNVKSWYFEECYRYEQMGYDYFYEISEFDLEDFCESNEYEFYEDGTLV